MRSLAGLVLISAVLFPPAAAQEAAGARPIKQIVIYGNDRCPAGDGDEVVVCARRPEPERYRVPRALRQPPPDLQGKSWANRARALEAASPGGLNTCSPIGSGGFSGCFQQQMDAAREAREQDAQPE